MDLNLFLKDSVEKGVSDIFIVAGKPLCYKVGSHIETVGDSRLSPSETNTLITAIYEMANHRSTDRLFKNGDDDFSFSLVGVSRFRVSAYKQRGSLAAVIRVVALTLPEPEKLHIPKYVLDLADIPRGMILVSGPSGSGKSTTLACLIDIINETRSGHIITLEDPIEYLHKNKMCIVSQRELELDTESYVSALRASLRQAPDVILVGEMRDYETIRTAMTAAETGHLVISTLHTTGAASTVDRIVDVFPPNQQPQIRVQLSMLLQSVVSQQLVPTCDGGVRPVFEIMHANNAVRTMIRDAKTHQLDTVIAASAAEGMVGMDASLAELCRAGVITDVTAKRYALNFDLMARRLNGGSGS